MTDTEILDWIEEQARKSRTGISFDWCNFVEDGHVVEKGFRFMRQHYLGERGKTIREAVRMAAEDAPFTP